MNNNKNRKRRTGKNRQSPKQAPRIPRKRHKPFTYDRRRAGKEPLQNRLILTHIAGICTGNVTSNTPGGNLL